MASYRYRTKIPAEQTGAQVNGGEADIVVFSKPCSQDLELLRECKQDNVPVVVDFCDDHFDHQDLGPIYREFASTADHIVCNTPVMRKRIGKGVVIPDPYEMPELPPHADGNQLLWFGHNTNLRDVQKWSALQNIRVVTGPKVFEGHTHWSPENIDRAMREANICIFPHRDESGYYKSNNRFLNAVRMGLFPVCNPHPAYNEFWGKAWIGDMKTGLQWAAHFKDDLNSLVEDLQCQIRVKYSPEAIGQQWQDLFASI